MTRLDEFLKKAYTPGTPQGRLSFGLTFFVLGLMFALLGFWKTVLILVLTLIGVFIGSAETIGKATANLIDKVIPPRNRKIVYTAEDLEKVRRAAEMKKEAQKPADKQQEVNG